MFEQLHQVVKAPSQALAGTPVWDVPLEMGIFPAGTPATMQLAQRGGRRTVTEMVDAYGVQNAAVRKLLIDDISHAWRARLKIIRNADGACRSTSGPH